MKKQNKIIFLRGLPGSGKSTWAKQYQAEHPETVRTNKDELRAMLHDSKYSKGRENFVLAVRDFTIDKALEDGHDVICDDTNFHEKHFARMKEIAARHMATIEIKDFTDVPLEECIERDRKRPNYVGEQVIRRMHRDFLQTAPTSPEYNYKLPNALLCDIDGTLALFDRKAVSAYSRDFTKDTLNRAVSILLHRANMTVILLTGRQEKDREQTELWLRMHDVPYEHLYMRQNDDKRSDYIVKRELYDRYIKDKYNILMVFDDRLQVCRLWHELGLPLFRVGDPDADF